MRISDWSSDVCSSDLRLTHSFSNRSRVSTFREFRTAEKAAELAPAFNHVAHAPVSLARLDRRGAIKQCRLPRRLASYPLPLAVSGLFKFPGMDVVIPCPDASRSEEHTSELQSLMRISYAVFCLKKKKKRQQQSII